MKEIFLVYTTTMIVVRLREDYKIIMETEIYSGPWNDNHL